MHKQNALMTGAAGVLCSVVPYTVLLLCDIWDRQMAEAILWGVLGLWVALTIHMLWRGDNDCL